MWAFRQVPVRVDTRGYPVVPVGDMAHISPAKFESGTKRTHMFEFVSVFVEDLVPDLWPLVLES